MSNQARLEKVLGPLFEVRSDTYSNECDLDVRMPTEPRGGSITVCLEKRRWAPGGSMHAFGSGDSEWFGVPTRRTDQFDCGYKGRGWQEQIAEDIKEAVRRIIKSDIEEYGAKSGWDGFVAKLQATLNQLGEPKPTWREEYQAAFEAPKKRSR